MLSRRLRRSRKSLASRRAASPRSRAADPGWPARQRRYSTRPTLSPCLGYSKRPCSCRELRPCWSSGVFVLVQEAAETVTAVDAEVGERVVVGDRFGQWRQRSGVVDALMGPVRVVERLVFAQGVQQMSLVEDQRTVEQFAAAGADPPFHDRVHAGYPDAAAHDGDAAVGEDGVE